MTEFPNPEKDDKDQYIDFLHDKIQFLQTELEKSEQEKLQLKQQLNQQKETPTPFSSQDLSKQELKEKDPYNLKEKSIQELEQFFHNRIKNMEKKIEEIEEIENKNNLNPPEKTKKDIEAMKDIVDRTNTKKDRDEW